MFRSRSVLPEVALGFVMIIGPGCSNESPPSASDADVLPVADLRQAAALFEQQACNVCHGNEGGGIEGAGPALGDLGDYWTEDLLEAYLRDPDGYRKAHPEFDQRRDAAYELEMPAFEHLDEEERRLLARWLLAR